MTSTIDALTDEQATTVLALVLDHEGLLPDPSRSQELHAQVTEAATEPIDVDTDLDGVVDAAVVDAGDGPATQGALARGTLAYLAAAHPHMESIIEQATAIAAEQEITAPEKFEPVTTTVGVLTVLALQTDVQVQRGSNGKWHFKIHKRAMSDSTLAKLLGKLIATYTGGTGT